MCELFAVSSARPARVRLRFAEFATHGAPVEPVSGVPGNPDGWGAAYFDGPDAHVLREPVPAVRSVFAQVLEHHDFHSPLVLAHVRRASRGPVSLANTQPFVRELGGRVHVFAHNGDLPEVQQRWPLGADVAALPSRPVGQTDSEHVFCQLLGMLEPLWRDPAHAPGRQARLRVVEGFAERVRELGPANFLYSDGECLFAHAHRRRQADGVVREPGMYLWLREPATAHEHEVAGLQLRGSHEQAHRLAMLASVPLGAGDWRALPAGTVVGLAHGERFA
jgi:glutamine amidotransferase